MDEFTFDLSPIDQPQQGFSFDLTPLDSNQSFASPGPYQPSMAFDLTPLPSHEQATQPQETWMQKADKFVNPLLDLLNPASILITKAADALDPSEWWKASTQGSSAVVRMLDLINSSQSALFGTLKKNESVMQDNSLEAKALRGLQENPTWGDVVHSYGSLVDAPQLKEPFTYFKGTAYEMDTGFVPRTIADLGGNLLGTIQFDPMNLVAPFLGEKVIGLAGKMSEKLAPLITNAAEKAPVIEDVAQAFSKTAFRTDAENTLTDIISHYENSKAVKQADTETQMMAFEKRMVDYAKENNLSIDEVKKQVLDVQEAKFGPAPRREDISPLAPVKRYEPQFNTPESIFHNTYIQPALDEALGPSRALREREALDQAQQALMDLGYRIPEDTLKIITEYKYPDVTTPDIRTPEGLFIKPNDPGFSDPSSIPLENIKATRYQQTARIPEFSARGGTYYNLNAFQEEEFKAFDASKTDLGGINKIQLTVSPRMPLVIDPKFGGGHSTAGWMALDRLAEPKIVDALIAFEGAKPYVLRGSEIFKTVLQKVPDGDKVAFIKEFERLASFEKEGASETLNFLADRYASDLAKEHGYDSILTFDSTGPFGGGEPDHLFMLDSVQAISKEIKQQIFQPALADKVVQMGMEAKDWAIVRKAESIKAGFVEPELHDQWLDYALHRLTPEGEDWIVNKLEGSGYGRTYTPVHASQFARTLSPEGLSASDMNGLTNAGQGESISKLLKGFKGKLWIDDPAELNMIRELRSLRARTNTQILYDASNQLGKPILPSAKQIKKLEAKGLFNPEDYAPEHWQELAFTKDSALKNDPRLALVAPLYEGRAYEPAVAEVLNKLISLDAIPGIENRYLRYIDAAYHSLTTNWKGTALNFSPAYLMQNFGGALWNASVDGMYDVTKYGLARKILRGEQLDNVMLNGTLWSPKRLNKIRREFGIGLGFATVEASGLYEKSAPMLYRIPGIGRAARFMYASNQGLESSIRFGHLLGLMDQGVDITKAVQRVKAAQFDYITGLTPFERILQRYIVPFYTWSRFNLPFQVKGLFKNPRPFVQLAQVVKLVQDQQAQQRLDRHKNLLPEYVRSLGIPTTTNEDGTIAVQVWGRAIPAGDLEMMFRPGTLGNKVLQSLNPILEKLGEQRFNYDAFLDRKIEEFPGEKQKFLGIDMRRRAVNFLKILRPLQDLDRLFQAYTKSDSRLDVKDQKAIRQALRFFHGIPTYDVNLQSLYRYQRKKIQDLIQLRQKEARKGNWGNVSELDNLIKDMRSGL